MIIPLAGFTPCEGDFLFPEKKSSLRNMRKLIIIKLNNATKQDGEGGAKMRAGAGREEK